MNKTIKKTKILITSGGTIVKIDDVRHLSNFSTGYLMSEVAEAALIGGYQVYYLCAKTAKKPYEKYFKLNPLKSFINQFKKAKKYQKNYLSIYKNLSIYEFETFDEYSKLLKEILKKESINIVFLGAAVSDYGMRKKSGKISSSDNKLKLIFTKNQKIIKFVKIWSKSKILQVGFKLLSVVKEKDLIKTAKDSGKNNNSDVTIANDLYKNQGEKREVIMVTAGNQITKIKNPKIGKKILDFIIKEYERRCLTFRKS